MQLLNPYALAWLPLIAVLVLVARHRASRPRRGVANLYLWQQTRALDPARLAFNRLRRHRLLALQIAFMVVVIAALAKPSLTWKPHTPSAFAPAAIAGRSSSDLATVGRTRSIRVLLLTRGNFFLEQSLRTNPALTVDRGARAGVAYDVVACDACEDPGVEDAAGLLSIPASDGTNESAGPLSVVDSEHPIGAGLISAGTAAASARPVHRPETSAITGDVILRAGDVPVLVSSTDGSRRRVSMNIDLSASSLPLSAAFPVLMANTIDWLAARDETTAPDRVAPSAASSGSANRRRLDDLSRPLLAIALVLLLVEWRFWSSRERRRPALICRSFVVALTALGVAGVKLPFGESRQTVMFALDRSASLPAGTQSAGLARVNVMSNAMRPDDRAGLVAFGLDAAVERPASPRLALHDVTSTISPTGTNIEDALRVAREALPRDGVRRVVLVSDGRATAGNIAPEVTRATSEGIHIDILPADSAADERPAIVKSLGAPEEVRVAEPFVVAAEIAGPPGAHAALAISSEGRPTTTRDVQLGADGTASVKITDRRSEPGVYVYEATLDDDQAAATGVVISVTGTPHVLYVGHPSGSVASALSASGFLVTRTEPAALPSSTSDLISFDAIVLDDVPADRLAASSSTALASFVEQGGGLLVLGAPRSLDVGGYPQGPLGRVLPLDVRPRTGQRSPAMGLVVAFDKSGSMADLVSGVEKIELARQAVNRVLEAVRPTDAIGVVAFDANPVTVSPLVQSPDPRRLAEGLRAVNPGGSTAISPALARASAWLRSASVTRRHVLLVSDGRTTEADAARLRDVVRNGGFELSVIAIGADADRALLEQLAVGTDGRAYFPDDLRQLPMLAAREAARAAGGGTVEERFRLRELPHPITAGLSREDLPVISGYVVTALKPGAESVLISHLDDPVLAAWRFGLGRVAVYTADLASSWSSELRRWAGASALWLQTTRWIGKRGADNALRASIVDRPDGAHLIVEANSQAGEPLAGWDVRAALRTSSGGTEDLSLSSTAPGWYETPLTTASPGPYVASVTARNPNGSVELRSVRGVYWPANRERRAAGIDMRALTQIARATGGRVLGPADNPFDGPRPRAYRDIWSMLAAAALILFLLDVALRRGLLAPRAQVAKPAAAQVAA